jgi:nitric oxide dioxygenase
VLTEEQKELVKATVPVLRANGVALTEYFYNRMLSNNPELKETFNMGNQRSGAQAKALAGAVLAYAENIDDPSVLAPVIELVCNKHVSLNIQAPDYAIVGENLLHSISEVLAISMDDPLISAWAIAYGQLADLFIATEKAIYSEHETTAGSWLGWRNFIIKSKIKESDEITSFYLTPEDGKPLPLYKPGQYITLRIMVPELGIKQPRQYSLSDSPSGEYLRISVKREYARTEDHNPGYVSSTLHQVAQEGDRVELSAPCGNFFLVNADNSNVFISAGIGQTPMLAMLNQLVTGGSSTENVHTLPGKTEAYLSSVNQVKKPIYFIHAARGSNVHGMRAEVQALANENRHLHAFVAYENVVAEDILGKDYHLQGRLDLKQLPESYLPKDADYYLCGPAPFMQQQRESLLELCIPVERIHSEAFGPGGVAL